jgi:outer membrane protein assembly factor BamB
MNVPLVVPALAAALALTDLPGTWSGFAVHDGDSTAIALEIEPAAEGRYLLKGTIPAIHVRSTEFGQVRARVSGDSVALGPFRFVHDARTGALVGTVPAGLLPVYEVPLTLRRATSLPPQTRTTADGVPAPEVAWSFATGAPLWAGPVVAGPRVYAGDDSGRVHCLNKDSGRLDWSFRTGGAIRGRVLVEGQDLYVASDDGRLYRLDAGSGERRWAVQVESTAVVRQPIGDPESIWDRYGSDPVLGEEHLYLGTHDGRVLALDPETGATKWAYRTGGPILAAVRVDGDRVYAGSYDGRVHALDAASGKALWTFDTRGPVVSTPALAGDRIVVGSRSYDLYALATADGRPLWKRYSWFSWVESSPTVRDGIAYVGSSDASAIHAYDVATGELRWKTDVHGWAWGQPAVDARAVWIGTVGAASTNGRQAGAIVRLDRATGRLEARLPAPAGGDGQFGFAGSPALGADGTAYFTALDGRVVALKPR